MLKCFSLDRNCHKNSLQTLGHTLFPHVNCAYKIKWIAVDVVSKRDREGYKGSQRQQLAGRGGHTPTLTSHQPLEHGTMQYSSSASRLVRQPSSQTSRIHPKGASHSSPLNLLHNCTALSQPSQTDPCLSNSALTIKIRSEGASSPTLPLTQRANALLKMHILLAHLVYLMHMHHTFGTKRNDIASDTEYPSSHIQFRFLQEEAGGFFPLHCQSRLNLGKVWNRYRTCWKKPIWLDSHLHT